MQFAVTFRHMDATEALKGYARERLARIKKYFPDPMSCHVVMSTERHNHRVDVNVQLHNGFVIAGHEVTENMYSSIDLVAAKIERQVRRYKDKLRAHKPRETAAVPVVHSVVSEPDVAAPEAGEAAIAPAAPVVKREQLSAEPMTTDEAIMRMNLVHQDFFVFRDMENGDLCVLYRRGDGDYGLIQAGARSDAGAAL